MWLNIHLVGSSTVEYLSPKGESCHNYRDNNKVSPRLCSASIKLKREFWNGKSLMCDLESKLSCLNVPEGLPIKDTHPDKWIGATAIAVISFKSIRRKYPSAPSNVGKVHRELFSPAVLKSTPLQHRCNVMKSQYKIISTNWYALVRREYFSKIISTLCLVFNLTDVGLNAFR